ncbi:MAG: hypothetical protein AAGI30_14175, partial [Planctomycetota bacterium]
MRFDTSQSMRMGQQMKLAPRMIQSMEILQMALPQLEERIEQELESNIALELADGDPDTPPDERPILEETRGEAAADAPTHELDAGQGDSADDFERLGSLEEDYGEAFDNAYESAAANGQDTAEPRERLTTEWEPTRTRAADPSERDGKLDAMTNTAARSESLTEQLLEQWSFLDVREELRVPGRLIVEHIEEDGYLRTPLETILDNSGSVRAELNMHMLENALSAVQLFLEPVGIGARDTRECLLLQLDAMIDERPVPALRLAREIVADHLDDLTHNRIPKIVHRTGAELDEVRAAIEAMKGLKLHPGRELVSEAEPPIVPDAAVEWDEDAQDYR